MKRVIEIDKDMFNVLRNAEDMDCEVSAEAHIINKSLSLNGLLDMIIAEMDIARFIDKDTRLCKNANASGLEVAMEIIDKYKESEDKQ